MDSNAQPLAPPAYAAPQPAKSGKKKWVFIILGILLFILLLIGGCCAAIFFGVSKALKSSQVYVMSIQRAQASPCAVSKLGQPITSTALPQGGINENNGSGNADVTIPVSGPQGTGSLHTVATRDNSVWTLTSVTLTVGGTAIDLPPDPAPCP
jgi:Cytochrome oxidase complex assembly protein 1